jgi:ParB/RepB/Spo0J family partition protein
VSMRLKLDPWRVRPFADQPRKRFRGIDQLAGSIRAVGQVTPIVVRPITDKNFEVELVDGERRLQACRKGGMLVEAIVDRDMTAGEQFAMSVAANFCRDGHDCIEVAHAVERFEAMGRSVEDIAVIFGKSTCWVYQHRSLLQLHPDVRKMLEKAGDDRKMTRRETRARGRMTFSVALLLVQMPQSKQLAAAKAIMSRKLSMAAARAFVLGFDKKRGPKGRRMPSPTQRFQVLWNATDTYRHTVERYAALKWDAWQTMVGAERKIAALTLAGQLDRLAKDVAAFGQMIMKVAKK